MGGRGLGGQDIFVCGKMMSKPGRGRWVTARKPGGWTLGPAVSARPVSTAPSRGHPERPWNLPPLHPTGAGPASQHRRKGLGGASRIHAGHVPLCTNHVRPTGPAFPSASGPAGWGAGWCALAPVSHFAGRVCLGPKPAQVPGGGGGMRRCHVVLSAPGCSRACSRNSRT